MAFVNRQGGEQRRDEQAASGQLVDFDPDDPTQVKVHYDLSLWTFDQRAELSEALAVVEMPHGWDGEELVVPEIVEAQVDALFERLEAELGPFPVGLEHDAESTEFGLDEWSDADRRVLSQALVEAEVPHRWEGTTVLVAQDAEDAVDDLLDAIEAGELLSADDSSTREPPDGALGSIFVAADRLARDPVDARARTQLLHLHPELDGAHPPYAFAPRTWASAVDGVNGIVEQIAAEASGPVDDAAAEVAELAASLRDLLRPYV